MTSPKKSVALLKMKKMLATSDHPTKKSTPLPPALNVLQKYAIRSMKEGETIRIRMEKEIFGNEYNAYIVREDIENFCHLQAISTGCIAVYMRYITCKLISLIYIYIIRFINIIFTH